MILLLVEPLLDKKYSDTSIEIIMIGFLPFWAIFLIFFCTPFQNICRLNAHEAPVLKSASWQELDKRTT